MMLPYAFRLICLSLACFFLVHLALGLLAQVTTQTAVRLAEKQRPAAAARLLLALRFTPPALAAMAVSAVCVPSFLRFEPLNVAEPVGWFCLMAAGLCVIVFAISMARAARAVGRSLKYVDRCRRVARTFDTGRGEWPALVVEGSAIRVLLAGVLRPRVILSSRVLASLSGAEFDVVLRHEYAHRRSHDNLKRLFLVAIPGLLPFLSGFAALEQAWVRFSEWAADDRATAGDVERSLALAAALVRLSRLGQTATGPLLSTSLLDSSSDLAARVERLLNMRSRAPEPRATGWPGRISVALVTLSVAALFLLGDGTLAAAHAALEQLIR